MEILNTLWDLLTWLLGVFFLIGCGLMILGTIAGPIVAGRYDKKEKEYYDKIERDIFMK